MRNLGVYYLIILVPFALLLMAIRLHWVGGGGSVALFFLYVLFRQCTDAWRLMALGVIDKVTWRTIVNPLLQTRYFRELYWFKG